MTILEKLLKVQIELKAPKNQYNSFGNYSYRSNEDILEAVKPILAKYRLTLIVSDEVVQVGDRIYVKATSTLYDLDSKETLSNTAYAREEAQKKGMDGSQITGASSSYARKYLLNGLFAIDDNKDSDSTNKHGKEEKKEELVTAEQLEEIKNLGVNVENVLKRYKITSIAELKKKDAEFVINAKRKSLEQGV